MSTKAELCEERQVKSFHWLIKNTCPGALPIFAFSWWRRNFRMQSNLALKMITDRYFTTVTPSARWIDYLSPNKIRLIVVDVDTLRCIRLNPSGPWQPNQISPKIYKSVWACILYILHIFSAIVDLTRNWQHLMGALHWRACFPAISLSVRHRI